MYASNDNYRKIQDVYWPKTYVQGEKDDIALVELANPFVARFKWNATVQPACLGTEFVEKYEGQLLVSARVLD